MCSNHSSHLTSWAKQISWVRSILICGWAPLIFSRCKKLNSSRSRTWRKRKHSLSRPSPSPWSPVSSTPLRWRGTTLPILGSAKKKFCPRATKRERGQNSEKTISAKESMAIFYWKRSLRRAILGIRSKFTCSMKHWSSYVHYTSKRRK